MTEKYKYIVESGERDTPEGEEIRSRIIQGSPNADLGRFTVAQIEFEYLRDEMEIEGLENPKRTVSPLLGYIASVEDEDDPNLWKAHLMAAKVFLSRDEYDEALDHSKKSLACAPEEMKGEIERTIDYIVKQRSAAF